MSEKMIVFCIRSSCLSKYIGTELQASITSDCYCCN